MAKKRVIEVRIRTHLSGYDWRADVRRVAVVSLGYYATRRGAERHARKWFKDHMPGCELRIVG